MDSALQQLVEWLKSASPELWRILLKQITVMNVIDTIVAVALIAIAFFGSRWFWKLDKKFNENGENGENPYWDNRDNMPRGMALLIYWLIFGCLSLLSSVNILYVISRLLNPEYYAISLLMHMLTK